MILYFKKFSNNNLSGHVHNITRLGAPKKLHFQYLLNDMLGFLNVYNMQAYYKIEI